MDAMDTKDFVVLVVIILTLVLGFWHIDQRLKNISRILVKIFMCVGGRTYRTEYKEEDGMIDISNNCKGDLWENIRMISNKIDRISVKHLETYPCKSTYRIDDELDDEGDHKEYEPDIQSIVVLLERQERQLDEIITLLEEEK